MKANEILRQSAQHIEDRASQRDQEGGERSMARCVAAFNALTGHQLSERDGWLFMVQLKAARATTTATGLADDYQDGAAYFALAGESVAVAGDYSPPKPGEIVFIVKIDGNDFQLASGHVWYAQDFDGSWHSYENAPAPGNGGWMPLLGEYRNFITKTKANNRWDETLQWVYAK